MNDATKKKNSLEGKEKTLNFSYKIYNSPMTKVAKYNPVVNIVYFQW